MSGDYRGWIRTRDPLSACLSEALLSGEVATAPHISENELFSSTSRTVFLSEGLM
jgi:hypothetical protein